MDSEGVGPGVEGCSLQVQLGTPGMSANPRREALALLLLGESARRHACMKLLLILSCGVGLLGCVGDPGDDSMYLTGTEESAVLNGNGDYTCEAPKKVLICHIPPGNPENAHTICVGAPAVAPHQEHHGDLLGACDAEVDDPPPGDDCDCDDETPPPPPPPDDDPPPPEVD